MIRITETQVFGFKAALRGMRNPMESWDRSDSVVGIVPQNPDTTWANERYPWLKVGIVAPEYPCLGNADLTLMKSLILGGNEHRKFLRDIGIWCDIEPNRGCWQELDTYKISTVRNSCSTMHKLGHRDLLMDDFQDSFVDADYLEKINVIGREYRAGGKKDFKLVIKMKRMLPEGFLQKATYHMNYENALSMFQQRRNHRLPEWSWTGGTRVVDGRQSICDWIWSLPYMSWMIDAFERRRAWREDWISMIMSELSNKADEISSHMEMPFASALEGSEILGFLRGVMAKYGADSEPVEVIANAQEPRPKG